MKLIPTILVGTAMAMGTGTAMAAEWATMPNSNGQVVYSTETDAPSVVLGCSEDGTISTTFSTDGNVMDKVEMKSNRRSIVKAEMTVGDGEAASAQWAYYPRRKIAMPGDNKFARRMFNAVVTGSQVTLDLGHRGTYAFNPPEMNDEFKTFAKACTSR